MLGFFKNNGVRVLKIVLSDIGPGSFSYCNTQSVLTKKKTIYTSSKIVRDFVQFKVNKYNKGESIVIAYLLWVSRVNIRFFCSNL